MCIGKYDRRKGKAHVKKMNQFLKNNSIDPDTTIQEFWSEVMGLYKDVPIKSLLKTLKEHRNGSKILISSKNLRFIFNF